MYPNCLEKLHPPKRFFPHSSINHQSQNVHSLGLVHITTILKIILKMSFKKLFSGV